jgi:hypothetical protein
VPDLRFNIIGDSRSLKRALNGAAKDVKGFKSKLGGIGSIAAGVFGGGAALAGLSSLTHQLGSVVEEAREAARVGRLTDAVIKSTGGAANVTAGQVSKLAEAISNKTGIDDEQIQSAQNLLLTFTNVRNEVGKGNDIFNQASQAAIDMSVALGTDSKSAAIQLGKALNDPVKGITALSRAGVSFTAEQKDQIKTLVASGKTLEAQKMILAELGKEFGGAAAAASDPMQRLDTTVNNLKERIGTALLPYIEKAATWLGEKLPGALDRLEKMFSEKVLPVLKDVTAWLKDKLGGAIEGGKKVIEDLANAFGTSQGTIVKALGAIAVALGVVALAWNAGPGIIVTAVVALGVALLYAYNKVDWFRAGVQFAFKAIAVYVRTLIAFWRGVFERLAPIVKAAFSLVSAYVRISVALWTGAFRGVRAAIEAVVSFITGPLASAFSRIGGFASGVAAVLSAPFNALKDVARATFNAIARFWNSTIGKLSFTIPDWKGLPHRGETFGVPDIPYLAQGGIVTRPTIAMIGEAGPEAVIPLSRAGRPANIGAGVTGGTIMVQVDVNVDPITGRKVYRLAQDDQRKNGPWNIKLSPTAA